MRAYFKAVATGQIKTLQHRLLAYLHHSPRTIEFFRNNLQGSSHQSITAALSMLEDDGCVRKRDTGKDFSLYSIVLDPDEQFKIREERLKEKYKHWKKRGIELGFFELWRKESGGVQGTLFK